MTIARQPKRAAGAIARKGGGAGGVDGMANEQMSNNAHMHQQEAARHLPNQKGLTRLQN
jgi:hypothetical protein